MKATLLNSADKISGVQGANKTVVDPNGLEWDETPASFDASIPLDPYLGAGALNARRALAQYKAGPYTGGDIADLGWAFGETGGFGTLFSYPLAETFGGGYISITLAWDRIVDKLGGSANIYGGSDVFTVAAFNDLDLFLMPVGWQDLSEREAFSISVDETVEHIWGQVPAGDYEIVVYQPGGGDQKFGLAWWFGDGPPAPVEGDFDEDGDVDQDDLTKWKDEFGTNYDGSDFLAWQGNYGFGVPASPTAATVPEPSAAMLGALGLLLLLRRRAAEVNASVAIDCSESESNRLVATGFAGGRSACQACC